MTTERSAEHFDALVIGSGFGGSVAALRLAANELYLGHSDLVITGGADTTNDHPRPRFDLPFCSRTPEKKR